LFDAHFSTKQGGAGLGLAICRRLAEECRGGIEAVAVDGCGACFRLLLPAAGGDRSAARFERVDLSALVADDHELVRAVAGRQLEKLGCRVATVASAGEAVDQVSEAMRCGSPPDMVMLDRQFGDGGRGEDAARELREKFPGLFLVACSGYEPALVFDPVDEPFFDALLPKPFSPEELARLLSRASASKARTTLR